MFVLALSIPEAFDDLTGGLAGPVMVAVCYFAFRTIRLLVFWTVSREDAEFHGQVLRFAASMLMATTLLLVAARPTERSRPGCGRRRWRPTTWGTTSPGRASGACVRPVTSPSGTA